MRYIFSKGEWICVNLPKGHDPCWSISDTWYYATIWAAFVRKGHDSQRATILAEAAVTKRMYPDTQYDSILEKDLLSVFDLPQ